MHKYITAIFILCMLAISTATYAAELPDGVISGQVFNMTTDGSSVTGDNITLLAIIDGAQEEMQTTTVDAEGNFRFENLPTEYQYVLVVNHTEVDYYLQIIFGEGETEKSIDIQVYDATTDNQAVSIRLAHAIIYVEEEFFTVSQVFWLVNDGDRTYIGTDGVLVFTLPEDAITFEAPKALMADYQLLDRSRVTYLVPFPPGERQLYFSYTLPKPDSAVPYLRKLPAIQWYSPPPVRFSTISPKLRRYGETPPSPEDAIRPTANLGSKASVTRAALP